jgi:EH domain-containing protein 3/EH domain-containing protein 1
MFGKKKKQEKLLEHLDQEFIKIQQKYHLPAGDFPNPERFKQNLALYDIDKFKLLREDMLAFADQALAVDLPKLMSRFPHGNPELEKNQLNPFDQMDANPEVVHNGQLPPAFWDYTMLDKDAYLPAFHNLKPRDGLVSGAAVKPILVGTGLSNDMLATIWRLSDWDNDGYFDSDQFCVAMHLIKAVELGAELPDKLPQSMIPNRKI